MKLANIHDPRYNKLTKYTKCVAFYTAFFYSFSHNLL